MDLHLCRIPGEHGQQQADAEHDPCDRLASAIQPLVCTQNIQIFPRHDDWLTRDDLRELAGRAAQRDALDAAINAWTASRELEEIETVLQAAGIPVHRSALSADLMADAQLAARQHFVTVPHPQLGPIPIENSRLRLSATPARVARPGPIYGEDNEHVLRNLLGYDDAEIAALSAAGVLE